MCVALSKMNIWCRPGLLGVFVSSSLLGDRFPDSGTFRPLPWRLLWPSDLHVHPPLAEQLTRESPGPSNNTFQAQMWLRPFRFPPAHLGELPAPVTAVRLVESCGSVTCGISREAGRGHFFSSCRKSSRRPQLRESLEELCKNLDEIPFSFMWHEFHFLQVTQDKCDIKVFQAASKPVSFTYSLRR